MTDELDARLNASSPHVSDVASVNAELTALAYSTERLSRLRRRLRFRHIGIPVLIGAMALGGTGAALSSPIVQRSLGIAHAQPKAVKPFPKVPLLLPISGCTLTLQLTNGSTQHLNVRGIESLQAATEYLSHVDMVALEQSDIFKANYQPVPLMIRPGETADQIADETKINLGFNRISEEQAVSQALAPGMIDAADKKGQDPSAVGAGGRLTCPGSGS
ncbi:MAG: hypothetical protein QOH69_2291 [Actinomycetota bacterium]|jgi:hypothetical protein|nr:hypothetical protein [Actinomycetota bacterium]